MAVNVGDTIVMRAKTKRVAPSLRTGVVEEVLDETQPRLLVRWSDDRTTVIAPLPDAYRIERKRGRRPAAKAPAKAKAAPAKPAAKTPAAKAAPKKRRG